MLLYIHGGGWVIANLDTYDASARALTNAANVVVVSTHYRQAPEHKFPAAHQDVYAAYRWATTNAKSINADSGRVAVAGESAGGNMAAYVSIRARDDSATMPLHQLLVYPVVSTDTNTPSYQENANAKPLSKAGMQWFFSHYLKNSSEGNDPRIALLKVHELEGTALTHANQTVAQGCRPCELRSVRASVLNETGPTWLVEECRPQGQ